MRRQNFLNEFGGTIAKVQQFIFTPLNFYLDTMNIYFFKMLKCGDLAKDCLIEIIFGSDHFFDYVPVEQKSVASEATLLFTKLLDPHDFERLPRIYDYMVERLKGDFHL